MKIKVTEEDINKGRERAGKTCGCPIWHSVVRQLNIPESQAKDLVRVATYETLKIGNTEFALPPTAISMQRILVEYPLATMQELEFFAPVKTYSPKKVALPQASSVEDEPELLPPGKRGYWKRIFS